MSSEVPLLTPLRSQNAEAAIVFIHGFGGNATSTWGDFPRLLAADKRLDGWDLFSVGYATRLVPDVVGIWSADAPLDRLALLLHTAMAQPPLGAYKTACLVSHSMGGLITQRALVDHVDLSARISHLFLFGTPSAGLAKAGPFRFLKRQARDMAENGPFVSDLRKRWTERFSPTAPFRLWTVAGDRDEFVPSSSSLGPFPLEQQAVVAGDHISIVKPASDNDLGLKIVLSGLCGDAAPAGPRNPARVAVESREFVRAVRMLEPHQDDLDPQALVALALALEETGRQQDAIALLEKNAGTDTDAMGVLAGRLKRRWLTERRRSDAVRALQLYHSAYDLAVDKKNKAQAYYHGINAAFLELAYGSDNEAAKKIAAEVLQHCAAAPSSFWRIAAEADSHLILGDTAGAMARYREAIARNPTPREMKSMCQQALRLADLLNEEQVENELGGLCGGADVLSA